MRAVSGLKLMYFFTPFQIKQAEISANILFDFLVFYGKFRPAIARVMGQVLKQWIPALAQSTLRASIPLQCDVIMSGIVLKREAFWKVVCSRLMFRRGLQVMLSITLEITCRPEISIHIDVSSIVSTTFKCQKEKCQGHILVHMFCSGKRVFNCTVWETSLCRVQSFILLSPH